MAYVISDLSKYVIAVFMAFYTYESFAAFRGRNEEKKEGIYTRQIICMFIVHFVSFAAICLETSDLSYIIFYGFQQILLFATIALFRAIYKDAPFVIMDEPTAALDPLAECEVYEGFDKMVGNKTAIYISHRLASCRFCQDILFFDQGKVVQRGSHDELKGEEGLYRELWNAQAQYYVSV